MIIVRLALQSLRNRALTATLTVLAIAVSVMLLIGVEKVRTGARQSFADTISGTDLLVGARTGNIQLLLYALFRIGNATNNITWSSYSQITKSPDVAWSVPLSLGDSHRGFRVLGTSLEYFQRYKFRRDRTLTFQSGKPFADLFDAVLGADVAAQLGYQVGDPIVVAHGLGAIGMVTHEDKPFRVAGILEKTGTPVDRTVHVSLEAIEAIHIDWHSGAQVPGEETSADEVRRMDLTPKAITAALFGLKTRAAVFRVQRAINEYRLEPLTAVLPGAALQELWGLVGTAETALAAISAMVVVTALLGMATMILTTLNERRREMAILRSVGASPRTVLGLLVTEAAILTAVGAVLGATLLNFAVLVLQPWIDREWGIYLPVTAPTASDLAMLVGVILAGTAAGLLPALLAYRQSVADGMAVRS
jgi:putative ABC transport system permease protein